MCDSEHSTHLLNSVPTIFISRERSEDSTTNFIRHINICQPGNNPALRHGPSAMYSAARLRYWIAVWCARRHRPFTIVDDSELVEIFKMLYERVEIPSRITISRDIQEMFRLSRDNVSRVLVVSIPVLHIAWSY
jgi:hypothetical protein